MGPGEEGNAGFKLFGSNVEKFSAAVAAFWTISDMFKEDVSKAAESAEKTEESANDVAEGVKEVAENTKDLKDSTNRFTAAMKELKSAMANDVVKAIDQQGGQLAKYFGSNGVFAGVTSFGEAFKAVLPLLRSFLLKYMVVAGPLMLMTKLVQSILTALKEQLDEGRKLRRQFGITFDPNRLNQLAQDARTQDIAQGTPIGAQRAAQIAVNLNEELKNSRALTGEMIANVAVLEKGLGVDATASAKFFGRALRTTEATAQDLGNTFSIVAMTAEEAGLNVSDMVNTLAAAPELAQQFALNTRQGQIELARSLALTQQMGVSMSELRSFGDQFFDLETSATAAASLRNFGVDISSQELMFGSEDPASLIENIVGQLDPNMSRMEASALLSQNPQLQSLFGNVEGLQAAQAGLAQGLTGSALQAATAKAGKSPQEQLNDNLSDYVTATKTLGEGINDAFEKLGQNIAKLIAPDMLPRLIDTMIDFIDVIFEMPFMSGARQRQEAREAERRANEFGASRSRLNTAQRLVAQDIFGEGNAGLLDDGQTSMAEIRELVYGRASSSGMDVNDAYTRRGLDLQIEKMMERLVAAAESNPNLRIVTVDGRVMIEAQAEDAGTGNGAS
jgi:hypothetical protein